MQNTAVESLCQGLLEPYLGRTYYLSVAIVCKIFLSPFSDWHGAVAGAPNLG